MVHMARWAGLFAPLKLHCFFLGNQTVVVSGARGGGVGLHRALATWLSTPVRVAEVTPRSPKDELTAFPLCRKTPRALTGAECGYRRRGSAITTCGCAPIADTSVGGHAAGAVFFATLCAPFDSHDGEPDGRKDIALGWPPFMDAGERGLASVVDGME